jgi:HSP20 family protein
MPEKSASVEPEAATLELVEPHSQFERINRVLHMSITEADDVVTLQAEVPGFGRNELEIKLESRRLTIIGKKAPQKHKPAKSERCSCEVLRVFDLPVEVDSTKTTATLKDSILELRMPRLACTEPARVEIKTE